MPLLEQAHISKQNAYRNMLKHMDQGAPISSYLQLPYLGSIGILLDPYTNQLLNQ